MASTVNTNFKNETPLPLDFYYCQPNGQPWPTVEAAHNGREQDYRAKGKTSLVGDQEYWYVGGTGLEHFVLRFDTSDIEEKIEVIKPDIQSSKDFVDDLSNTLVKDNDLPYETPLNTAYSSQSTNGASVSIPNRSITIPSGATGINSYAEYLFTLASLGATSGDVVMIRLLINENVVGTVNQNSVTISLTVDGVNSEIVYTAKQDPENEKRLIVEFPFVVGVVGTVRIRVTIKSTAPVQTSSKTITWENIGLFFIKSKQKEIVKQIDYIAETIRKYAGFQPRASVYSELNGNNSYDNTVRLQEEIDNASQTSGILILPKNCKILITDSLFINSGIEIIGKGETTVFNPNIPVAGKELFHVSTLSRIKLHNFNIERINSAVSPTSVLFDSGYINSDSEFENITFMNMPDGLLLDYINNLRIHKCVFKSGTNSIKAGYKDPLTVKGLGITECRFESNGNVGITTKSANDLTISNNRFVKADLSTFHTNNCIEVFIEQGENETVKIIENTFKSFRSYAVRIAASLTGTLRDVIVSNNTFSDKSASTTSDCMYLTSDDVLKFNNALIEGNVGSNKRNFIRADKVSYLNINSNSSVKQGTGAARGLNLTGCPDPKIQSNNLFSSDQAANII